MALTTLVDPVERTEGLRVITDAQHRFFLENGYLILRSVVRDEELRRLEASMRTLVELGLREERQDPDYLYRPGHRTGTKRLFRIEYVIDKSAEAKALLGQPFILRSVEKVVGKDLIPTWDSMVLKLPDEGIEIPWHRDAGTEHVGEVPIFNVDFYLDEADEDTCVWAYPGSHLWSQEQANEVIQRPEFSHEGATPLIMRPGDVLFHNILLLHGSPPSNSPKLRRVLYYEFRTADVEYRMGPHTPEYIPLKQRVLLKCIEHRKEADWTPRDEEPFAYDPPAPFRVDPPTPGVPLGTYRYPHGDYWRR